MCEVPKVLLLDLTGSVNCDVCSNTTVTYYQARTIFSVDNNVRLVLGSTQNCSRNVLLTVHIRLTKLAGVVGSAHVQNAFEGQMVTIRLSTTPYLLTIFPLSRIDMSTKIIKCFSVGLLSCTHVLSPYIVCTCASFRLSEHM
jgi:hypothetical protein